MISVKKFILYLFVFTLYACNDSNTSDNPKERPAGIIQGSVFLDSVKNATVIVYAYDNGVKGKELGKGTTDDNGEFSISIKSANTPFIAEASNGNFPEESSGISVSMGDSVIRAISFYSSGMTHVIHITHFTNLAAGLTRYLLSENKDIFTSINDANNLISSQLGFNILTTKPLSLAKQENATISLSNSLKYGFIHAGISKYMEDISGLNNTPTHTIYNSILYSNNAFLDISDGVLDGLYNGELLSFGTIEINSESYRSNISLSMLQIADNVVINKTGLPGSSLGNYASLFNSNTSSIYGDAPIVDLDANGPIITNFNIANKDVLFDMVNFNVKAVDTTGVSKITIDIGSLDTLLTLNGEDTQYDINNGKFADGDYIITVTVLNNLGASTSITRSITITNIVNTISGMVLSPPLITADVKIYDYTGFAKSSLPIATGRTDSEGKYSIPLRYKDSLILVEASKGRYIEASTGTSVSLTEGQFFSAVIFYSSGSNHTVNISPYTTFAHAKSIYLNTVGVNERIAVNSANDQFISLTGLAFNTLPLINVTDPGNFTFNITDNHKYNLLIAGISQLTSNISNKLNVPPHTVLTTVSFTNLIYKDVLADGFMDGLGLGGLQLSISTIPVIADIYRHDLSVAVMDFLRNLSVNKTGLSTESLFLYMTDYNDNNSLLYRSNSNIALDEGGPKIIMLQPSNLSAQRGFITPIAEIQDVFGFVSTSLQFNGLKLNSSFTSSYNQIISGTDIDTSLLADGLYDLSLNIKNILNQSLNKISTLKIDNTQNFVVKGGIAGLSQSPPTRALFIPAPVNGQCAKYVITTQGVSENKITMKGKPLKLLDKWSNGLYESHWEMFDVPVNTCVGNWDVVITDNAGNQSTSPSPVPVPIWVFISGGQCQGTSDRARCPF